MGWGGRGRHTRFHVSFKLRSRQFCVRQNWNDAQRTTDERRAQEGEGVGKATQRSFGPHARVQLRWGRGGRPWCVDAHTLRRSSGGGGGGRVEGKWKEGGIGLEWFWFGVNRNRDDTTNSFGTQNTRGVRQNCFFFFFFFAYFFPPSFPQSLSRSLPQIFRFFKNGTTKIRGCFFRRAHPSIRNRGGCGGTPHWREVSQCFLTASSGLMVIGIGASWPALR